MIKITIPIKNHHLFYDNLGTFYAIFRRKTAGGHLESTSIQNQLILISDPYNIYNYALFRLENIVILQCYIMLVNWCEEQLRLRFLNYTKRFTVCLERKMSFERKKLGELTNVKFIIQ